MTESLSSLMSGLQVFVVVLAAIIIGLYVLTVIWVIRDAPQRGVSPVKWGIIALIPFVGAVIYSAIRPNMLINDREEQELDYLLRQRELMKYGECGRCSYPVQDDYLVCPNCGSHLKNVCVNCDHPLNPAWNVCPYCATKVAGRQSRRRSRSQQAEGAGEVRGEPSGGHMHEGADALG